MDSAASLPMFGFRARRFFEFLRLELAPSAGRWRASLRITLACVAASYPVMAFHLHVPLLVMILMFLISREDTTTTLLGTVLGLVGVTIGCGLLLLTYVCFADLTWLRVLLVPGYIALGLFLNRILTLGPMGSAIALPLALGMIVPDVIPNEEFLTRFPFYVWWAAVLGLSVNLAVQYLLNPERAQTALVRGLTLRLDTIEAVLQRLAGEKIKERPSPSLSSLALSGAAEQLHLLKLATAAEPWLKEHQKEFSPQIILIDRLVTAASVLEEQGVRTRDEATRIRLRRIAGALVEWRLAVIEHRWPGFLEPLDSPAPDGEVSPMLSEIERVLNLISKTKGPEELPDELKAFPKALEGGAVVADAFKNPEYVHFAVKGALAGFICYLIFTLSAYQGIYTSVVTCVVCSLSTIGASAQKGVLRFAGSAVGGGLGVLTLMYVFPHMDSIGGFWIPFGAVTYLAAYVTFGSPSISYAGYQIGLAFYKCVLQSYGPYTELRVVRDRLIGIVLGLTVFGLINQILWPVKAMDRIRQKLGSILQTLAKGAALPDETRELRERLAQAYDMRLKAYQEFRTVQELLAGARFEPSVEFRRKLEETNSSAQRLLLYLLAIVQHRSDLRPEAVTEPLRVAASRFRKTLADELQILSDRLVGQDRRPDNDLQAALTQLEHAVSSEIGAITDADIAAHVRARLSLYQDAVPIVQQMARLKLEE